MRSIISFSVVFFSLFSLVTAQDWSAPVPEDFPKFTVPGQEEITSAIRDLYWLHYPGAGPKSTMWDAWLPGPSLWPDTSSNAAFREQWAKTLLSRKIDAEGYVSTHQHAGLAHNDGWPFPLWNQAGGIGWQFTNFGMLYDDAYGIHEQESLDGFTLSGVNDGGKDQHTGRTFEITDDAASLTTPVFSANALPFLRFYWQVIGASPESKITLEWSTEDRPEFSEDRKVPVPFSPQGELEYIHLRLEKNPLWKGKLRQFRLCFENMKGSKIQFRNWITACDSRHPTNQSSFIRGSVEYVRWTGDIDFLQKNIERMRTAARFAIDEFQIEKNRCVLVPWAGHEGRSGLVIDAEGNKTVRPNEGVGGNYWDIMPFGGRDTLATIYLYDALLLLAQTEDAITAHPDWKIAKATEFSAKRLRFLAQRMKDANGMFWNAKTGRFVSAIDLDGAAHDYGHTFVNCEAIYYDFAKKEQALSILRWLNGDRVVEGDTSQKEDIYFWRFGLRSTTRRNLDYYFWGWSSPESVPFGDQVQDGGAVLGFAFHDLMSRIAYLGPDNVVPLLRENARWFKEVQAEGGYRNYYAPEKKRGNLQGGNIPGGLGLDREFFESVLYPQVMLSGLMGFQPSLDGFAIQPKLPKDWPSLSIDHILWQDQHITLKASSKALLKEIEITTSGPERTIRLVLPPGNWVLTEPESEKGVPQRIAVYGGGIDFKTRPGILLRFSRR